MPGGKDSGRCWTCQDRKIRCDKGLPTCLNCLKSSRICQGYGLRLSWPKPNDRRRSILGTDTAGSSVVTTSSRHAKDKLDFLHVSFEDLTLHHRLADQGINHPLVRYTRIWQMKQLPRSIPWSTTAYESNDLELIQYYESQISRMVSTVSDKDCFAILMQMSFLDNSPSSTAVVQSICALSCLHQHGQAAAMKLHSQALASLRNALTQVNDVKEQLQSVMAAMFLGLYEIFNGPDSSYSWTQHIWHAKGTSIQVYNADMSKRSDLSLMLDWVYYHDVFTKFSLSHYNDRNPSQIAAASDRSLMHSILASPNKIKILGPVGCSADVLVSISQIFDIIYEQSTTNHAKDPSPEVIDKLERRLRHTEQVLNIETNDNGELSAEDQVLKDVAELFRLAALIYLHRAVKKASPNVGPVATLIQDAFIVLARIETCDRTFPIFIVGCEARDEDQRLEILRVFRTTEEKSRVGNVARVRKFVERLWAQDDLDSGMKVAYTDKITAALSTSNALPTFT